MLRRRAYFALRWFSEVRLRRAGQPGLNDRHALGHPYPRLDHGLLEAFLVGYIDLYPVLLDVYAGVRADAELFSDDAVSLLLGGPKLRDGRLDGPDLDEARKRRAPDVGANRPLPVLGEVDHDEQVRLVDDLESAYVSRSFLFSATASLPACSGRAECLWSSPTVTPSSLAIALSSGCARRSTCSRVCSAVHLAGSGEPAPWALSASGAQVPAAGKERTPTATTATIHERTISRTSYAYSSNLVEGSFPESRMQRPT
jgi:hypothetical protein